MMLVKEFQIAIIVLVHKQKKKIYQDIDHYHVSIAANKKNCSKEIRN